MCSVLGAQVLLRARVAGADLTAASLENAKLEGVILKNAVRPPVLLAFPLPSLPSLPDSPSFSVPAFSSVLFLLSHHLLSSFCSSVFRRVSLPPSYARTIPPLPP